MGLPKLFSSNAALDNYVNSVDKLAEMFPVFVGKNNTKESRSQSKEIQKILSRLVSAGYLLRRISRWSMEYGRKVLGGICNELAMFSPGSSNEFSPVPGRFVISRITPKDSSPEWNEKFAKINE